MLLSDASEISVVIPAYNAASTIESALKSIQRQTISNLKIIVVNDGSTDTTGEIVQRLAISDARIHLISQVNGGIVDALNAGLRLCETEYIARHDADDLAVSDRFEKQVLYLESNPDCVAVSGAVRHIDENDYVLRERVSLHSPDLADPTCCPQIEPYLIHPFLMMRRSALDRVGGYRYVFHAEDTDLYWRLQDVGRLYSLPDILGDYRIHSESVSGASIVNGRVSAVNSQRAGISELRRRSGQPDVSFPKSWLSEYEQARSLKEMLIIASRDLSIDEARVLEISAGIKLLETAGYRPFEVELEDCSLIGRTYKLLSSGFSVKSKMICIRLLTGTSVRLIRGGKFMLAYRLCPASLYPLVALRFMLRFAMPKYVMAAIHKTSST